ncbi:MAG: biotin/lipoyl-binding carrier protein [Actinomycetota bacterium]|nr:biotin/lipoyl-binding carrier protein [Actinomycetota bacterium]MDH4353041.1 biotin/lipoyl-binding carrier protein [Actinomycetota bacterium]MDH5278472.1 biotin/lipoyl-binding carrier protein [Actinomycetota bacterium]
MPEVVRAEMVANVIQLLVSPGDTVAPGDPVVVLESMKMEIPVLCEHGGEVLEVGVSEGDVVQEGDLLVQLG